MPVTVRLPRALLSYWSAEPRVTVEARTLLEALTRLDAKHPGISSRILDDSGTRPRAHVSLFVNDQAIGSRAPGDVPLKDGDIVHVLPAVSGGALDGARKGDTLLALGTKKGVIFARSRDRKAWKFSKPQFAGVPSYHATFSPDGKRAYVSTSNEHWGPAVRTTSSLGAKWDKATEAPKFPKDSGLSVTRVWNLTLGEDGALYAGTEPAGLFRSEDGGRTWKGVEGINDFPGRKDWMPGGGGLCMHTILPYPGDARRMVVAASAVGIFGSGDAGRSWKLMNGEIRSDGSPKGKTTESEPGTCPHKIVRDAKDPDLLYMQNHWGLYKRRRGETKWTDINKGAPSRFGFPMAAHPHDAGTVYTVPLEGDFNRVSIGGAFAVHRTRDGGKTWQRLAKGLPQKGVYHTVLREGLATDRHDKAGVYAGTTTGELYASRDEGASWTLVADKLPPILSVDAAIVG